MKDKIIMPKTVFDPSEPLWIGQLDRKWRRTERNRNCQVFVFDYISSMIIISRVIVSKDFTSRCNSPIQQNYDWHKISWSLLGLAILRTSPKNSDLSLVCINLLDIEKRWKYADTVCWKSTQCLMFEINLKILWRTQKV